MIIKQVKSFIKKNRLYKKAIFWQNAFPKDVFDAEKIALFRKVYPYTMIEYKRLSNAYEIAKIVEKNKIKGAFVECGVWKGGCAAAMAFVADKTGSNRKIWLFDSFEGLPEPSIKDGKIAKDYAQNRAEGKLEIINKCVGPLEDVKEIFFNILKINPNNVVIKKGWFQNTLPKAKNEIGPISILRLDGDWYESTKCCLDNLYDVIIPGGYVIIDDYGYWEGTRHAVDEFFIKREIKPDLIKIDFTGVYFKKINFK